MGVESNVAGWDELCNEVAVDPAAVDDASPDEVAALDDEPPGAGGLEDDAEAFERWASEALRRTGLADD